MKRTNEGALQYEHALDHAVEFFSKAGSLFEKGESFYGHEESALSLFQKTWIVDPVISFKLLLWLRDCRGGAGNRSGFRECLKWLAENDNPEWIKTNFGWIPLIGRWDDLRSFFGTPLESEAVDIWVSALKNNDVLAAKWADRSDKLLRKKLGFTEKEFRQYLARIRRNHIVESKMCANQWGEVVYEHVPSVAMSRYTKAFGRHDEERFDAYKEALKKGEKTIHAGVLFPHDCVRTCMNGDEAIANAQFEALPNYMPENTRAIVISDTSASMGSQISGSVKAVHISQGMALYCSAKIPNGNPFHKKFMSFSDEGHFKNWERMTFGEAVQNEEIFDGAVGETHIAKALNTILQAAKFWKIPDSMMPTMLIIVSDMQFDRGAEVGGGNWAEVENCLDWWVSNGYTIPSIIYWNTAGYAGQPTTAKHNNVALVSGFSPAILKSILAAEDLTPRAVMMKTLEKYQINIPSEFGKNGINIERQ